MECLCVRRLSQAVGGSLIEVPIVGGRLAERRDRLGLGGVLVAQHLRESRQHLLGLATRSCSRDRMSG